MFETCTSTIQLVHSSWSHTHTRLQTHTHTHTHTHLGNAFAHAATAQSPHARNKHRPGVVVSYAIAGFAALMSSLCYAEFAADIPVAGGAFNYIGMT
jgi:hypothetical protein